MIWIWAEQSGAGRALTAGTWLGSAIVALTWRFGATAITTARRHPMVPSLRLGRVSREWLREHAAEFGKHNAS
ncbi:MAG TPA: hypothetical protein VH701_25495 [Vicinamibacterales bacterium]|jgi:hypothetical protein